MMLRMGVRLALLFFITACVWAVDVLLQVGWLHWIPEAAFCYLLGVKFRTLVPIDRTYDAFVLTTSLWLFATAWLLLIFKGLFVLLPSVGFFGLFSLGYLPSPNAVRNVENTVHQKQDSHDRPQQTVQSHQKLNPREEISPR
jgi:hypothetical protein